MHIKAVDDYRSFACTAARRPAFNLKDSILKLSMQDTVLAP